MKNNIRKKIKTPESYPAGELTLLQSGVASGKTDFFIDEALRMIKKDFTVIYFDTEMDKSSFRDKILNNIIGADFSNSKDAIEWLSKQKFYHVNIGNTSEEFLCENIDECEEDATVFIVYDFVLEGRGYSITCQTLNSIAQRYNIPILSGTQNNCDNRDKVLLSAYRKGQSLSLMGDQIHLLW